jgi:hypothetical protein
MKNLLCALKNCLIRKDNGQIAEGKWIREWELKTAFSVSVDMSYLQVYELVLRKNFMLRIHLTLLVCINNGILNISRMLLSHSNSLLLLFWFFDTRSCYIA